MLKKMVMYWIYMCLEDILEDYHYCTPIIDENNIIYLKLNQKIFAIFSRNDFNKLKTEIDRCRSCINRLEFYFKSSMSSHYDT